MCGDDVTRLTGVIVYTGATPVSRDVGTLEVTVTCACNRLRQQSQQADALHRGRNHCGHHSHVDLAAALSSV